MSSLIPAAASVGQQDAGNQGIDYGGMSNFFQHMDPLGNMITKVGGDPLNIYGHKNNPNALLFPGSNPNAGGVPSVLPNLGPQSMIPQSPMGAFQSFNPGAGPYNQMAAQSMGGQMFIPSNNAASGKGGMHQNIGAPGGKGGMMPSSMQHPINAMPMMVRNNQGKVGR